MDSGHALQIVPPEGETMYRLKWITVLSVCLAAGNGLGQSSPQVVSTRKLAPFDGQREKRALQVLLEIAEKLIVPAVDAMPADKFGFAPTDGEFKGVRTFGQMVKHLSATNHILAAAALGEAPPADAGDEVGPEAVRTKTEILAYLKDSFTHLERAVEGIGQTSTPVNPGVVDACR
jgi:DinB superfamily